MTAPVSKVAVTAAAVVSRGDIAQPQMESVLLFNQGDEEFKALASAKGVREGLCGYFALAAAAVLPALPLPTQRAALPAFLAALRGAVRAELPAAMDRLRQARARHDAARPGELQDLPGPHAGQCAPACRACFLSGLVGVQEVEAALRQDARLAGAAFVRRLQGQPHGSSGAAFAPASEWERALAALEAPLGAREPCSGGACCYYVQRGGGGGGSGAAAAASSLVSLRDFAAARAAAPAPAPGAAAAPLLLWLEEAHFAVCLPLALEGEGEVLLLLESAARPGAAAAAAAAARHQRPAVLRVLQGALDAARVAEHVRAACARPGFLCEPAGVLRFPYICPGGFYSQLWCWDALFAGIGVLPFGGARYLLGSMENFLDHTSASGEVPGCLTPAGPSATLAHAKPVVIQGALLGARALGQRALRALRQHQPAMEALLGFWERERRDAATGLYAWHDQMESGADDLPYAEVPSAHTPEWSAERHARAFSAPDVMVFLHREHVAYAVLLEAWAAEEEEEGGGAGAAEAAALRSRAAAHRAKAGELARATDQRLWHASDASGGGGYYCALNLRTGQAIPARTYQLAWPLWERAFGSAAQRSAAVAALLQPDMRAACGVRSTSSAHLRYELKDAIVPYSIWRGPVWINVNCVLCYALARSGAAAAAEALAEDLLRALARDLQVSGAWHECYHPDSGAPLSSASKGFLSWTVMAAGLLQNLQQGTDPTQIE